MWYLASDVHADVVFADVQIVWSDIGHVIHDEDDNTCMWLRVLIKMAARLKISVFKFISQILLENGASVSKKEF